MITFWFLGCTFFLWMVHLSAACDSATAKVFILAGQSNMVGMGSIEHMRKLVQQNSTHDEYAPFWNETIQDWMERDDVYCKFNECLGKLKVGFGAPQRFGPELGFGWVLGDDYYCHCGKPIFLLKTAWGGRDLAIDFRPPSSGKGNYSGVHPSKYGW